ncbi:hypothetical protein GGR51DRAFT_530151 [Nemania sp. FL0031]|nr:hypothetical protein GGR51DRAFT_530151 [Nemania sp. FL0031]
MPRTFVSRLLSARVTYFFWLLSLVPIVHAQWPARQLENFFPAWDLYLRGVIAADCASILDAERQASKWAPYQSVECILKTFPEFRKSEIAASSVVLGLLPTVLSILGPSITDLALLATRRPFLSLVLAVSSPAVKPQPHGEYTASIKKKLHSEQVPYNKDRNNRPSSRRVVFVSLVEYIAAIGALLNVAILAYQLSIFTVTSFAVTFAYLPAVWVGFSIPTHLASYAALCLRVKRPEGMKGLVQHNNLFPFFATEFTPCAYQQSKTLEWRKKGSLVKTGRSLTWLLNFCIVAHILFGTLTLSSLLFISAADAIAISARFFASTLVSQWIFAHELAGMKKTTFLRLKTRPGRGIATISP